MVQAIGITCRKSPGKRMKTRSFCPCLAFFFSRLYTLAQRPFLPVFSFILPLSRVHHTFITRASHVLRALRATLCPLAPSGPPAGAGHASGRPQASFGPSAPRLDGLSAQEKRVCHACCLSAGLCSQLRAHVREQRKTWKTQEHAAGLFSGQLQRNSGRETASRTGSGCREIKDWRHHLSWESCALSL